MAGRTDPEIALEFLAAHEVAEGASHLPAFSEALVTALAAKAAVIRERGGPFPGPGRPWPRWGEPTAWCSRC